MLNRRGNLSRIGMRSANLSCQCLVSLHAGEMAVQSRLDEGTTVTVALPLAFVRQDAVKPSTNVATLGPAMRAAQQDDTAQETTRQVKKSA